MEILRTKIESGYKVFSDGALYVGEVGITNTAYGTEFLPHGRGTKTCANGDKYEGNWRAGQFEGYGTLTCANGDEFEGEWGDSGLYGHVTATYANGDKYSGGYSKGKCHGQGTFKDAACQTERTGYWENGVYIGEAPRQKPSCAFYQTSSHYSSDYEFPASSREPEDNNWASNFVLNLIIQDII